MIVITGANGFIGRNLLKSFPLDQDIIVVDYSYDNLKEEIKNRRSHIYLLDPPGFLNMFRSGPCSVDFIFHQGACTDTTCYDARCMLEKNYDYTYELINLCVEFSTPLVYASSASVYGDGPFIEGSTMSPKNIYAKSKSMIDDYALMISQIARSQITGLRYFNVYGPLEESKGKMASVLNQFKDQIDTASEVRIFEHSEKYRRDFVFVDDVVKINRHFYENNISGIFNCGTGKSERFTEIPRVLKKHYKFDIIEVPMPDSLQGKYQKYTEANLERLRDIGKYNDDFLTLEEGIERYVQYWQGK